MPRRCPTEWNTGGGFVTCEARKQGGRSLLLPGLPVRARLLRKGGDKPKGLNRIAERERVTLAAPRVEHTPPCVFHIPGFRRTVPPEVEHDPGAVRHIAVNGTFRAPCSPWFHDVHRVHPGPGVRDPSGAPQSSPPVPLEAGPTGSAPVDTDAVLGDGGGGPLTPEVVAGHRDDVHRVVLCAQRRPEPGVLRPPREQFQVGVPAGIDVDEGRPVLLQGQGELAGEVSAPSLGMAGIVAAREQPPGKAQRLQRLRQLCHLQSDEVHGEAKGLPGVDPGV